CVQGSVPPGTYLTPHNPKSLAKALSVSVSFVFCVSSSDSGCTRSIVPTAVACGAPAAMPVAVVLDVGTGVMAGLPPGPTLGFAYVLVAAFAAVTADSGASCDFHGRTLHSATLAHNNTIAVLAPAAQGSQFGAIRLPKTSAAA